MFGSASVSAQSYMRILSIHNATRKRERENPIQLNTRRDFDPLHSSCNQRPAMGTPQMCNCVPKQLH
jgi:hypothetical protein